MNEIVQRYLTKKRIIIAAIVLALLVIVSTKISDDSKEIVIGGKDPLYSMSVGDFEEITEELVVADSPTEGSENEEQLVADPAVIAEAEAADQGIAETRNLAEGSFRLVINTDKLQISQDIVRGVTEEKLKEGIGRHITTGYPNEESGNVVLSGHRWFPGSNPNYRIFEDLDQLEHGDNVSVFYEDKEFIYEIFEDKIVGSKDVEILKKTDEPQLTLYTCTPKYTSLNRLVYVAKLVEVKPSQKVAQQ